jgi:hypothetical protein
VAQLMASAQIIICVPDKTPGTEWELEELFSLQYERKTVFANPGNCLIQDKKPDMFNPLLLRREQAEQTEREGDPPVRYKPAQLLFHEKFASAVNNWEFPAFQPLGEWFAVERSSGIAQKKFIPIDRQVWGHSPALDLLELGRRRGLLVLSERTTKRLNIYKKGRNKEVELFE